MSAVPLKKNLTVENVFDAVVAKAGSLRPDQNGQTINALLEVAGYMMEERHSMGFPEYRLTDAE